MQKEAVCLAAQHSNNENSSKMTTFWEKVDNELVIIANNLWSACYVRSPVLELYMQFDSRIPHSPWR